MPFEVDTNGILQPLGVRVLSDSRHEIIPGLKEYTEEIPGRDGEIDFGVDLQARVIELTCALKLSESERFAKVREIAGYLNPKLGAQTLTFADQPGKVYNVRVAGRIPLVPLRDWLQFTIPFKMANPYIMGAILNELTGSGTAANGGNVETTFTLIVLGPVTNPSATVAGVAMTYTGTVAAGSVLTVDTGAMTADLDGANALAGYNGAFPKLQPGDNSVVAAAAGTTKVRHYDRWI